MILNIDTKSPPVDVLITCTDCGVQTVVKSFWGLTPDRCKNCDKKEHERQEAEIQEEIRRAEIDRTFRLSGIPARCLQFMPEHQAALEKAVSEDRGLYIWGPTGTGKTVLASHIAHRFLLSGPEVRFLTANRLVMEAQATYSHKSTIDPLAYIEEIAEMPMLVIDDIGRNKVTDDAKRILFEIMDSRTKTRGKTIFTSERSLEELRAVVDDAFVGRIIETCDILHMTGRNWRLPLFQTNGNGVV